MCQTYVIFGERAINCSLPEEVERAGIMLLKGLRVIHQKIMLKVYPFELEITLLTLSMECSTIFLSSYWASSERGIIRSPGSL
jgi:hypothetical protein